jgi:hypothetical protein
MAVRFAVIPIKYAPKRKMIDFALPVWKNKVGEFDDVDVRSWVTNLYQDKAFPTRESFNKAYDDGCVKWEGKPMILTKDDLGDLQEQLDEGAFDDGPKTQIEKMVTKAKAALETGEKVLFVY